MADNDSPGTPTTCTSTSLKHFLEEEVLSRYKEVNELKKAWPNDPENKPFESLYKARKIMEDLHSKLISLHADTEEEAKVAELTLLAIKFELGKNYADSEEPSTAERYFQECVVVLRMNPVDHTNVTLMMQAGNKLGIVWAERSENVKALEHLLRSKEVYDEYKSRNVPPAPFTEAQSLMDAEAVCDTDLWKNLESIHTHTLYFLAQVYSNIGEHETAANYCCTTLDRQIQSKEFDGIDWALNAASLSQFYITRQLFREGRHCLSSADRVLRDWQKTEEDNLAKKEELREKLEQAQADLSRCWIKYSINALQSASEEKKDDESSQKGVSVKEIAFKFEGLNVAEMEALVPVEPIETFDQARAYFLFGQEHVLLAKAFFTLDSHASDYASIVQDHSTLFRLLSLFENDIGRKCRMHKRRIDMLSDVINQLNPQHFLVICRQCHYELGEVSYEMADLKMTVAAQSNAPPQTQPLNKINKFLLSAIEHFEIFTNSFKMGERLDVPEDYFHSYIMAKLWVGRAQGKILFTSAEEERRNMQKSLSLYREIVDFAKVHPKVEEICGKELQMCKEMVELLPAKIAML